MKDQLINIPFLISINVYGILMLYFKPTECSRMSKSVSLEVSG